MTPQKSLIPSHFHDFHQTLRLLNSNGWSCNELHGTNRDQQVKSPEPFHLGGQLRERFAENFHLASVARQSDNTKRFTSKSLEKSYHDSLPYSFIYVG